MKAVVLLSGGLDSATCLALAKATRDEVFALSFDYGQRHILELERATELASRCGVTHQIIALDPIFSGSALTDTRIDVPKTPIKGIPPTYVPARNTVFLSIGLAYAEACCAHEVWIGANAVDYSGYPDCRPEYIAAFNEMARLATKRHVTVRAPLVHCTKAEIINTGISYGVDYSLTSSCYDPNELGACGECDSCRIRRAGFISAGVPDPTVYR